MKRAAEAGISAVVTASPAAARARHAAAAAVSRATAVRSPHREMRCAATMWATPHPTAAMRAAHREMWRSAAMRPAAVKCRTTVERGRAGTERRSAMGCGRAMERRFSAGCSSTSVDRSHRAETPGSAAGGPAPGRAGTGRRRHGRSPGCIEAPPRSRIGIADAAAVGGVMQPDAAREGGASAGGERVAAGVDGDVAMTRYRPSPNPRTDQKPPARWAIPKPIQNPGS